MAEPPPGQASTTTATNSVPVHAVRWHEEIQPSRLADLLPQIAVHGIRHPVQVIGADEGVFVIVDGAHRAATARALGWRELPVQVVRIDADLLVPGWSHVVLDAGHGLNEPGCLRLRGGTGPVVAVLRDASGQHVLRARSGRSEELIAAYRAVAAAYQTGPYERLESGVRAAPRAGGEGPVVHWHPPRWRTVVGLALSHQVLPAGVTRTAPLVSPTAVLQADFPQVSSLS